MARLLEEAHNIGQAMCYFILPYNRIPIARSTVQPITSNLQMTSEVQDELRLLDEGILSKLREPATSDKDYIDYFDQEDDDIDNNHITPSFEAMEDGMPKDDDYDVEAFNAYIRAEVVLPKGDLYLLGTITAQKHDICDYP
jgi:hypothetical protein